MGKMKFVVMLGAMLLVASSASANLVLNGDFATNDTSDWSVPGNYYMGGGPNGGNSLMESPGGEQLAFQQIATAAGQQYTLSIDFTTDGQGNYEVDIGNGSDNIVLLTGTNNAAYTWTTLTATFTAPDDNDTLNVYSGSPGNGSSGFAEVDVEPASTPEPATMSLLGLGLVGLIARKRKA